MSESELRAWEMRKAFVYGIERAKRDFPTIPAQEGAERMAKELLEIFDFWFPNASRSPAQPEGVTDGEPVAWFHVPTGAVVDPLARDLLVSRFTKELSRDVSSEFEPLHRPAGRSKP